MVKKNFVDFKCCRDIFRRYPYRERLHEGAELAHELREVPPLHQSSPELEGDAEHGQHHVRERQGGYVVVSHCLHPPAKNICTRFAEKLLLKYS